MSLEFTMEFSFNGRSNQKPDGVLFDSTDVVGVEIISIMN